MPMLRCMSEAQGISLVDSAHAHAANTAIVASDGQYTFADLLDASARAASGMLAGAADLNGARVCFMVAPSFRHVALQWAVFRAGGVAVPLCVSHPAPELAHVLDDAQPQLVIADAEFEER